MFRLREANLVSSLVEAIVSFFSFLVNVKDESFKCIFIIGAILCIFFLHLLPTCGTCLAICFLFFLLSSKKKKLYL